MLGLIGVITNNAQEQDAVTQITIALLAQAHLKVRVVWMPTRWDDCDQIELFHGLPSAWFCVVLRMGSVNGFLHIFAVVIPYFCGVMGVGFSGVLGGVCVIETNVETYLITETLYHLQMN